jgi:hypothetical protein
MNEVRVKRSRRPRRFRSPVDFLDVVDRDGAQPGEAVKATGFRAAAACKAMR